MITNKSISQRFFIFSFLLLLLVTVIVILSLLTLSNNILADEYEHSNLVAVKISNDIFLSALTNNKDLILEEVHASLADYKNTISITFSSTDNTLYLYEVNNEIKHNGNHINKHSFSGDVGTVDIQTYSYIGSRLAVLKNVYFGLPALSIFFLLLLYRSLSKNLTTPIKRLADGFKYYESREFRNNPEKINIPLHHNELDALISALDVTYEANIYKLKYEEVLRNKIDEANRSKNAFIASMAHDFKTPLISLAGLNDEVLRLKDSKVNLLSKAMSAVISDMENMVFNVLDFSKMDAGEKLKGDTEKTEVFQLVSSIERSVEYGCLLRQNSITFYIEEECSFVWLDNKKYRQVLRNLISNAIKYTENGQIHISVKRLTNNKIVTRVADSGVGVSDSVIDSMFIPFKREKDDLTEGSGIGLSFSKILLSQLGCNINFSNNKKKGATFWFDFPCSPIRDFTKRAVSHDKALILAKSQNSKSHIKGILKRVLNIESASDFKTDFNQIKIAFIEGIFQSGKEDVLLNKDFLKEKKTRYDLIKKLMKMGIPVYAIIPASLDSSKNKYKIVNIYGFTKALRINEVIDIFDESTNLNNGASTSNDIPTASESLSSSPILLAEDNDIYAQLVMMKLNRAGFKNIDLAKNGREAVELFKAKKHSVVLMDHMMPVMDGLKASEIIRSCEPNIYIIGFTAVKSELNSIGQNQPMSVVLSKDLVNFNKVISLILSELYYKNQIEQQKIRRVHDKL